MGRARSSVRFAWQKFQCWTIHTNFLTVFFIPAMLIDTFDFNHFIPLSLTLTLLGGHEVSEKQNLLASFSRTLFNWSNWNLIGVKAFQVEYHENDFEWDLVKQWKITAVLLTPSKFFDVGMYSDIYESIWFNLRSQESKKFFANYLTKFSMFGWNLVCWWDLLVWWTSYSFYLVHSIFKGENLTNVISLKKKQTKPQTLTLAFIKTFTHLFISNPLWR